LAIKKAVALSMSQKTLLPYNVISVSITLLFLFIGNLSYGQINMTQLGYLDLATTHSSELSDIWGYTDENGNEYAIVGLNDGTSIVDVTDPANPVEIFYEAGMNSIWRDIKTYGDYAYVSTEATQGLLIIDLSPLPGSTTLPTTLYTGPGSDPWQSAHNLYQADGYLYVFGANRDNGGAIILDVATDPMNPIEVGTFEEWYMHDGFVRNDTGYFSHVNDGFFTIVDLADKSNIQLTDVIGTTTTPSIFTHNCWTSEDGQTLFTTDEKEDGYIASYDISDPTNPIFLDQIQSSPGNDIIPHNAHVKGNYLITSYYVDGVIVHDISDPANMVEVANFDTSPSYSGNTFNGCWGVYPFFSSENLIASDIELGLYVLSIDPSLSSYLQGNITNFGTSQPINGALIEILGTATTDNSNVVGDYSIGTLNQGTYEVRYSKAGFYADTIDIDFVNGTIVTQDVALVQIPLYDATITVIDEITLAPISNANVRLEHTLQSFNGLTDANGEVTFGLFYDDNYKITAGQWGYYNNCFPSIMLTSTNNTIEIPLSEGIYDDFTFDFGWTESGTANEGHWVREEPVGTQSSGETANPFIDNLFDCSTFAYLTGNGASTVGGDDVDGGYVELTSPTFDLSNYINPEIRFSYWFFNGFGNSTPNDSLGIFLSNGTETVQIESFSLDNAMVSNWTEYSILVSDYLVNTGTMQLSFVATDFSPGNVLKAGVDYFRVSELSSSSIEMTENNEIQIFPNPASTEITILGQNSGTIEIYDLSGRMIMSKMISSHIDISQIETGVYLIQILDNENNIMKSQKQLIK
jgi:choice-of-anchor B domain-containing protein